MEYRVVEETASCPFCAEPITLLLDLSAGEQSYIEDCEVCCRPMQVTFDVIDGECEGLRVDCA